MPDKGNGCGKLSFVAPTVGASRLVCILCQFQLLQGPLHYLAGPSEEVWASPYRTPTSTGTLGHHQLLPHCPHLCLILPGDATQPSVQLQVLTSRELIKQGIELRAVAEALLYLEQVLEHAWDRE